MIEQIVNRFDDFRTAARSLLQRGTAPHEIHWRTASDPQQSLLLDNDAVASVDNDPFKNGVLQGEATAIGPNTARFAVTVPPRFVELAKLVACHRDSSNWSLLYRVLWRITRGERSLLEDAVDDDMHALLQMEKQVRRDSHKMKAFVRFRRIAPRANDPATVADSTGVDDDLHGEPANGVSHDSEQYIAWHRPDHRIVRLTAPFFARRFQSMRWTIFTADESAIWDGQQLTFGPGVPASAAPTDDQLEELWLTYYASTFNPARVKLATMCREMPTRYWATMPETKLIDDLIREAPHRVHTMMARQSDLAVTAANFLPEQRTLPALKEAAATCQGCPLFERGTQTVFGEGPATARLMLVGEQPGDLEDLQGRPFVGPAGQLLDRALAEANIDREIVYVTNAVKHFKWEARSKRRLHAKPNAREMAACRPWLEAEIATIAPEIVVCLGATAAQSLIGRTFKITKQRGQWIETDWSRWTMATYHPSALLRAPEADTREAMYELLVADLRLAAERLRAG